MLQVEPLLKCNTFIYFQAYRSTQVSIFIIITLLDCEVNQKPIKYIVSYIDQGFRKGSLSSDQFTKSQFKFSVTISDFNATTAGSEPVTFASTLIILPDIYKQVPRQGLPHYRGMFPAIITTPSCHVSTSPLATTKFPPSF